MRKIIVLDVETTGLSPSMSGRVCEIGAIKIVNNRIIDTFHSLINPQCPISFGAFMVHGISEEMLKDAPTFREIALSFEEFIADFLVAAYNAPFDVGFINHEFVTAGSHVTITHDRMVDILVLSRRYIQGLRSYSLPCVAQALRIKTPNSHRALGDAITAWNVLLHIYKTLKTNQKPKPLVKSHAPAAHLSQ